MNPLLFIVVTNVTEILQPSELDLKKNLYLLFQSIGPLPILTHTIFYENNLNIADMLLNI